jgi:uncharacterized membrane protein YfcA
LLEKCSERLRASRNLFDFEILSDILVAESLSEVFKKGHSPGVCIIMEVTFSKLIIICALVFLAGFIDSIAGGGGLISLPAYIFIKLPAHVALATNKFSSTFGTAVAVVRYAAGNTIHYKSASVSVLSALLGSFAGAKLALALDEKYLQYLLIFVLPVITVFIITRKSFGEVDTVSGLSTIKIVVYSILSGLLIGAYDGFFGPGTGTFLILIYTGVIGFNLTTASGNAKVVNLASNVSALVTFMFSGKILFQWAYPLQYLEYLGTGWVPGWR